MVVAYSTGVAGHFVEAGTPKRSPVAHLNALP
jgi:hypothetical protein